MSEFSEIARLIMEARRRQGLTQSELARAVDCKQSAISMFERGHETALARPKVEAVFKQLGIELPSAAAKATPAPVFAEKSTERRYCPVYDCPSNIPFTVQGALLVKPNAHVRPSPDSRHCAFCGDLLEKKCPECEAAVNTGACCTRCGTPYISIPPHAAEDNAAAWVETQHIRLRALGLLPL